MNAFTWPALSDQTWGILSLTLAVAIFVWLMFRLRRGGRVDVQTPVVEPSIAVPEETVGFEAIFSEYELRKNRCETNRARIEGRLLELRAMHLESRQLHELHASVLPAEVGNLAATVGLPEQSSWDAIVEAVCKAGSHSAAEHLRRFRGLDPYVTYREVLTDVAKKVDAKFESKDLDAAVEKSIILSSLEAALSKATPAQRVLLMQQLDANARKKGVVIFAAYTGMSTTIATLIGPVGWLAIIIGGVTVVGRVDYKKTVPAVMAMAQIRIRLIAERDQEMETLLGEQSDVDSAQANVDALAGLIERMRSRGLKFVPRSSVPM